MIADEEESRSDVFPIPKSDLALKFHHFGPLLNPTDLDSLFLEARSDIQHQIDQSSVNAASSKLCYNCKSADGIILEIWSRSVSTEAFLSLGQLHDVINGLSLYMMQGGRFRAVRFQVIQNLGTIRAAIVNTGSIRLDVALPTVKAKREAPPSTLVQYSSTSPAITSVNASVLTLPMANQFPIPYTDYSLRLGNLGSPLHPWDLETILIAVSAASELSSPINHSPFHHISRAGDPFRLLRYVS